MDENARLLERLHRTQAIEEGVTAVTETYAPRLDNYPYLSALLSANAEESRAQATRLRACIDALGGDPAANFAFDGMAGLSQALSGIFDDQDAAEGLLAVYAMKHLEIGSYRMLVKAADHCHEPDIAAICRHNLAEDLAMAGQIEAHLEMRHD